MEQEDHHRPGICWLWFVLFLSSVSASVTDPMCACQNYGSCGFGIQKEKVSKFPKKENVALGKPAKMSSQLNSSKYNETSGPAGLAVNGNRNTSFRPINQYPASPNCIHTGSDDHQPYWEVDLGEPYAISSIIIYWRNLICCPGYFGRNCTQVCPRPWCGNNHICNPVDGRCPKGCAKGTYGTECMETCGLCKAGQPCNESTGFCDSGCESGLKAPFCNETAEKFCSSTHEVTGLALSIAGSVLGASLVIGISIVAVLWRRRPRHPLHGEDLKPTLQGEDVIMTEVSTAAHASSTPLVQSLDIAESSAGERQHPGDECPEYINISHSSPAVVPHRKGKTYNPFFIHRPEHKITSDLETSSSDNDEYVEVI